MNKILVTGCLGTLGAPLVEELLRRGHDVSGLDHKHGNPGYPYYRADIREFRQLMGLPWPEFDYVYHLAAEFGRMNGEEFYESVWDTNVVGTKNVLEIQRNYAFKLLFASSSEVYGEMNEPWLDEGLTLRKPPRQQNDYAISKWVNELQIENAAKRYKTESMILRFFNAYGPGEVYNDYRSVVCLFTYRALHGIPFDVYSGYHRVFMYVDDAIRTIANACERFVPGETVNVGGTEYRSCEELANLILELTGSGRDLVTVLPEDAHNTVNKRPVIDKARALLGHDPKVTLEEGIPKTIEWMREIYG